MATDRGGVVAVIQLPQGETVYQLNLSMPQAVRLVQYLLRAIEQRVNSDDGFVGGEQPPQLRLHRFGDTDPNSTALELSWLDLQVVTDQEYSKLLNTPVEGLVFSYEKPSAHGEL
jgi:hypothetical protein